METRWKREERTRHKTTDKRKLKKERKKVKKNTDNTREVNKLKTHGTEPSLCVCVSKEIEV
jgi:hypothetical protein